MKRIFKLFNIAALIAATLPVATSCVGDDPMMDMGEGDVQMQLVINSDVTRAEVDDDELRSNCVVYISNSKGLISKYKGLENLPEQMRMKCGSYVAEAWTGDSVPASFDKKFYRGYQPFTVQKGLNSPVVKCGIANVVASVNTATIDAELMNDWVITIGHDNASLEFTADNADESKGYYMMPSSCNHLSYTIKGKTSTGKSFEKTGIITGKGENGAVERAHEYVLNLGYHPEYEEIGGGFITVTIDDKELLIEDEINIYGRPTISGVDFNLDKQVIGDPGKFSQKIVKIAGFGDIKNLLLRTNNAAFGLMKSEIDLINNTAGVNDELKNLGITFDKSYNAAINLSTVYVTFSASLLNKLVESPTEYRMEIEAIDKYGKNTTAVLRIAVGDEAIIIEDPVTLNPIDQDADFMAVGATSATISLTLEDMEAVNPGLEYRLAEGNGEWKFVSLSSEIMQAKKRAAAAHRAPGKQYNVTLKGLAPGSRYAYRAVADGFQSEIYYFTTESKFLIPNASMEDWSNYNSNSKVILPSANGEVGFWDSGNHGSATMDVNITSGSTDMFNTGSRSARLRSQFVGLGIIGKFAAGNIFTGKYLRTDGTDGVLQFGSPYNGSHPKKVAVMVNYRPGIATGKGANDSYIPSGKSDLGQIYIALTSQPIEVRTKASDRKLFNPDDAAVVAYGEYTFTANYGPDGALKLLEIPFEYNSRAKTQRPLYLVIVCTASKYGDYFSGGEGSLMYVDDFELVY